MARPRKADNTRKTYRVVIRLNADERKAVEYAAKSLGLRNYQYARLKVLKLNLPKPALSNLDQAIYIELKRIGVNINQLTRVANSGRLPIELRELLIRLYEQQDTIIKLLLK